MNVKVLVTGGAGYIGSKLLAALVREKFEVAALVRSSSNISVIPLGVRVLPVGNDYEQIKQAVTSFKPEVCIHLASLFLNDHRYDQIEGLIQSNILFGTQLIDSLNNCGCKKFINTGTSWQHFEGKAYSPVNLYAATKQAFEDILQYYSEAKQMNILTLKLFDTYGQDDPRKKIFSILRDHDKSKLLQMTGGEQEIDLVHVNDVVDTFMSALRALIENKIMSGIYGVGTGNPKRLKDWVSEYCEQTNTKIDIQWGARPYKPREVFKTWKDFEKIKEISIQSVFNKHIEKK